MKFNHGIATSIAFIVLCLGAASMIEVNQRTTAADSKAQGKEASHVYWLITASVKDGQLENLKEINAEMVQNTKNNEPGTLTYDWSVTADGKTCYFFEHYANSDAVMIHTKTFGEKYAARLLEMIEIKNFEVFGNPNETVKNSLSPLGANFHRSIGGYAR
jgi:quinol monooxygenase YgiN